MVHALHGIGRFLGIRKLELEGVTKDYITIQYAGKENLYVPVTQLDMVTKYIGPREDSNVKTQPAVLAGVAKDSQQRSPCGERYGGRTAGTVCQAGKDQGLCL